MASKHEGEVSFTEIRQLRTNFICAHIHRSHQQVIKAIFCRRLHSRRINKPLIHSDFKFRLQSNLHMNSVELGYQRDDCVAVGNLLISIDNFWDYTDLLDRNVCCFIVAIPDLNIHFAISVASNSNLISQYDYCLFKLWSKQVFCQKPRMNSELIFSKSALVMHFLQNWFAKFKNSWVKSTAQLEFVVRPSEDSNWLRYREL